ncbi:MAG: response regulator, partial [Candidatus Aureabacteria bacterium]|nr:response regulator [Candidatus Auribacterota bacterium]
MKHTIVYVDDDINLLKSFKRLLVNEDYDIQTFSDPHEALALDAGTAITLVISDFKMPIMNGIELLQQFKIKFPKAIRIMTTGFADLKTTIEAINKGEVYRYVNKPWNTSELKILIQQGIHLYEVSEKNIELQKLTQKQLEELKDFNENLEKKVEEKSREIVEKNKVLEKVNEKLDESFYESLRLILKIVEIKDPYIGNHSKRVSIIADLIAEEMDLEPEKKRDIKLGSFLHDIGKISLP